MDTVTKEQLQAKQTELKAEFERHKAKVVSIDNLMTKLQNQKEEARDNMVRAQGGYKAIGDLLKEDESANKDNDLQHGNTNDVQS